MGKVSVWIYIKNSCSCDSFTFSYFIYFQELSDQQMFGGFALWLLGSLSYCVSRVAFKGDYVCPSCESAFSGQSLSLFRLRCILHKEDEILSLFFDGIFLMHVRFFWAQSHSLCQHWTTTLALLFFFFFSLLPWTECSRGVFILSTYKKETFLNISLCSSYWALNLMLSTNINTLCCNTFQWYLLAAVLTSVYF